MATAYLHQINENQTAHVVVFDARETAAKDTRFIDAAQVTFIKIE